MTRLLLLAAAGVLAMAGSAAAEGASPSMPAGVAKTTMGVNATVRGPNAPTPTVQTPAPTGTPADASATANVTLGAGVTVRDSSGATVGKVLRTVQAADGTTRAVVRMGADTFTVPASDLAISGQYATSTMTKAQLRAKARGTAR